MTDEVVQRPDETAREYLGHALATSLHAPDRRMGAALVSIAASLVYANGREDEAQETGVDEAIADIARIEREAYERGRANALTEQSDSLYAAVSAAIELFPRIEELDVRADLAEALKVPLDITPEEPDPGRDWSRVRAHLFNPNGKWKYQVWLDYIGEREELAVRPPGVGPAGWHFDGAAMAKRALRRATANGTSGVSIVKLGEYWHLFVPNPPQGYPLWVQPDEPNERVDV
jgi:hypothetical protein